MRRRQTSSRFIGFILLNSCIWGASFGFAPLPTTSNRKTRQNRPVENGDTALRLHATSAKKLWDHNSAPQAEQQTRAPPLLSHADERHLLALAVEYRRIKLVVSEMQLSQPQSKNLLPSAKAEAAGYGTDIEAYETAVDDGQKARETLVTRNMGLVHFVVDQVVGSKKSGGRKKKLNSLSREDLIQEGAIGLARAVDRFSFEASKGSKFATYAVYWIRAAVLRCIAERDDLMRVPEHVSTAVRKMSAAARRLGLELDGDEMIETLNVGSGTLKTRAWKEASAAKTLAIEAGLTERQLREASRVYERRRVGGYTSFEPWMQSASQDSTSVAPSSPAPDAEHLKTTLSKYLRPKEIEALSWRYGLLSKQVDQPDSEGIEQELQEQGVPVEQIPGFRDYEAEAEADLFGPGGILSSEPLQSHSVARKASMAAAAIPKTERIASSLQKGGKWGEAMSFKEVGIQMAISAEYGRRLCSTALAKLKAAAEDGRLKSDVLF